MSAPRIVSWGLDRLRGPIDGLRARADRARDARDWPGASGFYQAYLDRRPLEGAIWVQLGNSLKEAGRHVEAERAYLRAEQLRPLDGDVQLQLGHLNKVRGDLRAALERYRRAVTLDAANEEAAREIETAPEPQPGYEFALDWSTNDDLAWLANETPGYRVTNVGGPSGAAAIADAVKSALGKLSRDPEVRRDWTQIERLLKATPERGDVDAALLRMLATTSAPPPVQAQLGRLLMDQGYGLAAREALRRAFRSDPRLREAWSLRRLGAPQAYLDGLARPATRGPRLFLDITDLLDVLTMRATVTGIQRVQCNLIAEVLAEQSAEPSLWWDHRLWRPAAGDLRELLRHLATHGAGDMDARRDLIRATKDNAMRLEPQAGDTLVATGVAYLSPEMTVRAQALKKAGMTLGAIIHDFIPLTHPELSNETITREFSEAIADILIQLDFAVPNSEFTRAEATRLMQEAGYPAIPMRAVPLAHSMRTPSMGEQPPKPRWRGAIAGLKGEPFVLCVGTFVAHKNQELLFNVWRRLMARGTEPPVLVLVGHRAHGVDELFRQLEATRWLDGRIRLFDSLDDDQIETLYASCLFTVFPSKVEGWGLPVGESLAHGKICVASNAASVPEVGGPFAFYIDPYDVSGATEVIASLLDDETHLRFLERRLASHFQPRTWAQYARELVAAVHELKQLAPEAGERRGLLALEPGQVLKTCSSPPTRERRPALPPRDAQAAVMLRKLMLVEGWGPLETWGVWMDGPSAKLRFTAAVPPGAPITVALQLRAAAWARGNQVVIRAGCGASAVTGLPPAWSRESERSIPRNWVVMIDCVAGRWGEVTLDIEVAGAAAPAWWGEPRTLVVGLVRIMFLPAAAASLGLPRLQASRPGGAFAVTGARMTPMSSQTLALGMRGRLDLVDGWRQGPGARAFMTGRSAALAFRPDAPPGALLRVAICASRSAIGADLAIELTVGDASKTFQLPAGQAQIFLWADCEVPDDGRVVMGLEATELDGVDAAGAPAALAVDYLLFALNETEADRRRLTDAMLLPAPMDSGQGVRAAQRRAMRFVVAGHMRGSYSLAQMNRRMALALERLECGSVAIEQIEGGRVDDLTDTPASERAQLARLAARPTSDEGPLVSISQHWPIWSRPAESDLSLAFFHWEEALLPRALVNQLNNDFDGVLAPTRFVAKALVDSGVMRPVVVVGDGPDIAPLLSASAAPLGTRRPGRPSPERPFTFLHVSSCFPRKGVDVLLRAYAEAFDGDGRVRLVIKGFANPHNDVAEQIARLRKEHPSAPAIEFINEDLPREEVDALMLEADAVVLPTRGEGFNLPALEGLAAGVPVIATGFGGHVDFLSEGVARLVDYRFAASQSHVASPGSTWVEPDRLDLADAMREAFARADASEPVAAGDAGRRIARGVGDDLDWARRVREAALDLLRAPAPITPKVAWVSSWGVRCGIAQYSAMLLERYPEVARDVTVLCDGRTGLDHHQRTDGPPVRVAWDVWQSTSVERLAHEIDQSGADAVAIQHQPGLMRWSDLAALIGHRQVACRQVVVELHTIGELPPIDTREGMELAAALRSASRLLVHTVRDLNAMQDFGLVENVALFPHGVADAGAAPAPPRRLGPGSAPIIGSYGFFLPRKGLDELIRAFATLRRRWPGARLRLVNAEFPDIVSRDEIERCRALARSLGVYGAIDWRTEFLPNEESQRLLRECDLVVLAHQDTKESASGAVRVALSSGAPVAVTPIPIFEDVHPAAMALDGADAQAIARGVAALLADRAERSRLQARAAEWSAGYAWPLMAQRMAGMIAGLVAASRVPGGVERLPQATPLALQDVAPDAVAGAAATAAEPAPASTVAAAGSSS